MLRPTIAATVVADARALVAVAQAALTDSGCQSAARRRVADEMFYRPGTATARALQECYALLDLELALSLTPRGLNESDTSGDRVQAAV